MIQSLVFQIRIARWSQCSLNDSQSNGSIESNESSEPLKPNFSSTLRWKISKSTFVKSSQKVLNQKKFNYGFRVFEKVQWLGAARRRKVRLIVELF